MPIIVPAVQGLTDEQVSSLGHLSMQAPVVLAVIFGSRARGRATGNSDVDLLVLPSADAPFDLLGFEAAAQQIVGKPRVEVTVLHPGISSTLGWEALRDAVVLWEDSPGTYEREVAAWHTRFREDAPRRREQAIRLAHIFGCP